MPLTSFAAFFSGEAGAHLMRAVKDALAEDGPDLTSNAVFSPEDVLYAYIVAKQDTLLAGMPVAPIVLEESARLEPGAWSYSSPAGEGSFLRAGATALSLTGSARILLRAERVILNFISHLSGIANLTSAYVKALEGTGVRLLDTRKTLPGMRYPEKYAVLVGGGCNHRKNLGELLMLKDNHIDAAGGITPAVAALRTAYRPTPPIEVECRTLNEVAEAVACEVSRIMLDNMSPDMLRRALELVPARVEVEISGGVTLENIADIARSGATRNADFISVGRLTHSAPAADFSMRVSSRRDN
ncbi:MAG: carboxylating nicotinate-nucleotide diphosphorylase [Desulfovibrio sp.]|nr:carboxylating nicotinate-nucleotide diphosphorylase [Desulfovibrio sp.]